MNKLTVEPCVRELLLEECGVIFGNTTSEAKVLRYCLDRILEKDSKDRYGTKWKIFNIPMDKVSRDDIEAYMDRCIVRAIAITANYVDDLIALNCPKKERVHEKLCRVALDTDPSKRHLDRFTFVVRYAMEISEKHVGFRTDFNRKLPS